MRRRVFKRVVLEQNPSLPAYAAPDVFDAAAYLWVECADWIPAMLTGTQAPADLTVGICAAGHKAMYNADWGGYPDADFLGALDPKLATLLHERLPGRVVRHRPRRWAGCRRSGRRVRVLKTPERRSRSGAFDAHLGGVGAGIAPGVSGQDARNEHLRPDGRARRPSACPTFPACAASFKGSILPGYYGMEAGQSAVGDLFNWFVNYLGAGTHEELTEAAGKMNAGASGLIALDWNNGNRTILVDQALTGSVDRADALHDAGRDLPGADRGDRVRRADGSSIAGKSTA